MSIKEEEAPTEEAALFFITLWIEELEDQICYEKDEDSRGILATLKIRKVTTQQLEGILFEEWHHALQRVFVGKRILLKAKYIAAHPWLLHSWKLWLQDIFTKKFQETPLLGKKKMEQDCHKACKGVWNLPKMEVGDFARTWTNLDRLTY